MKELHRKTLEWAKDRGILDNGKISAQALKLGSEFGELCNNLANNNPIKDDIGDCLVVCTILSNLIGEDFLQILDKDPVKHKTPLVPTAASYLGELQDKSIKGQDYSSEIRNFINQLKGIALSRHTTLEECWHIAYGDIKDRTGSLNSDGNFIKSTDKAYPIAMIEHLSKLKYSDICMIDEYDASEMTPEEILVKLEAGSTAYPYSFLKEGNELEEIIKSY